MWLLLVICIIFLLAPSKDYAYFFFIKLRFNFIRSKLLLEMSQLLRAKRTVPPTLQLRRKTAQTEAPGGPLETPDLFLLFLFMFPCLHLGDFSRTSTVRILPPSLQAGADPASTELGTPDPFPEIGDEHQGPGRG